jgi:hypothetical protein
MAGIFSTITLAVNTPVQVVLPGTGHYNLYFENSGGGKLYLSKLNSAGANPTSFMVPAGLYSPPILATGTGQLWISSDTAGPVSLYCAPR